MRIFLLTDFFICGHFNFCGHSHFLQTISFFIADILICGYLGIFADSSTFGYFCLRTFLLRTFYADFLIYGLSHFCGHFLRTFLFADFLFADALRQISKANFKFAWKFQNLPENFRQISNLPEIKISLLHISSKINLLTILFRIHFWNKTII